MEKRCLRMELVEQTAFRDVVEDTTYRSEEMMEALAHIKERLLSGEPREVTARYIRFERRRLFPERDDRSC